AEGGRLRTRKGIAGNQQRHVVPPERRVRGPGRQRVPGGLVRPRRRRPRHGRLDKGANLPRNAEGTQGVQGAEGGCGTCRRTISGPRFAKSSESLSCNSGTSIDEGRRFTPDTIAGAGAGI